MAEYSFLQKLRISFWGKIPIGEKIREGWKGPIMFYAFSCPIHGYVDNYPHGYNGRLICPKCIEDKMKYA